MDVRKIQSVGNRSYAISLPKKWVISNNLKEQSSVAIEEKENLIIIKTLSYEEKKSDDILIINSKDVKNLKGFLIFCYVKSIDRIKIILERNKEKKQLKEVKDILRYLDGYETTNEEDEFIEISFLFKEVNINLHIILQRICSLLIMMTDSIKEKDVKSIEEIELKIDRLYHLSRRVLFSCSKNPAKMQENRLRKTEDIFFYLNISKKLEKVGDHILKLIKENNSMHDINMLEDVLIELKKSIIKEDRIGEIKLESENLNIQKIFNKIKSNLLSLRNEQEFILMNKIIF